MQKVVNDVIKSRKGDIAFVEKLRDAMQESVKDHPKKDTYLEYLSRGELNVHGSHLYIALDEANATTKGKLAAAYQVKVP